MDSRTGRAIQRRVSSGCFAGHLTPYRTSTGFFVKRSLLPNIPCTNEHGFRLICDGSYKEQKAHKISHKISP